MLKTSKTDTSERKVYIPGFVAQCLIDIKKEQDEVFHSLRHPYVKHTTKKYNSEKQKTQATKIDLIAWVFRFCTFNYSKRSWTL